MSKSYQVILHETTLGVTQRALKALRDEIASRADHSVAVLKVPSASEDDCQCYGLAIVDNTTNEVIVIGDGFRSDGGGEGGAGARAAEVLLCLFGIRTLDLPPEEAIAFTNEPSMYRIFADRVYEIVAGEGLNFVVPSMTKPQYIDWITSRH